LLLVLIVLGLLGAYATRTRQLRKRNQQQKHEIARRKLQAEKLQNALDEVERLKSRLEDEKIYLQKEIKLNHNFEEIISHSKTLKDVLIKVEQVATTDSTVLILGETGTGKELIARAIHHISARTDRPIVKVNCAALPPSLIESELFGHEKGAFTGAHSRQIGHFELADRSTIFLDEIGELPLELQPKLLRVLENSEFQRLGNPQYIKVNVRVLAASNRDLEQEVAEGRFRSDLYYRLNVYPITCPPLRDHKEDIPLLVNHFVKKYGAKTGKQIETIPQQVMERLQEYHWPGNVRELENIIERAMVISRGNQLEIAEFSKTSSSARLSMTTLKEYEKDYIISVLESTGWRVSGEKGAAKILGLKPTTLYSRMKKLGIKHRR
jgi:transcriptional regulator with GAF, ATPase, and Fis domain